MPPLQSMHRQKCINLTQILVDKGIDLILLSYPYYPYVVAFQDVENRKKLMSYVLHRIETIYIFPSSSLSSSIREQVERASSQQQQQIKVLIHSGIDLLVPLNIIGELKRLSDEQQPVNPNVISESYGSDSQESSRWERF